MVGKILGDITAENDHEMLKSAFLETNDYRSLLEASDRCIVVGRRGAGKSALVFKLNQYWRDDGKSLVLTLSPNEDQVIGLRSLFKYFGENYVHLKAATKIAWRFTIFMEILATARSNYKLKGLVESSELSESVSDWTKSGVNVTARLRSKLRSVIDRDEDPESNIADLTTNLDLDALEKGVAEILDSSRKKIIFLVDKLDEGFSDDDLGVAIVDGYVQSVVDINAKFAGALQGLIFIRDNMYRSILVSDPDFTRNIESKIIRLHWDGYSLFNLVCNRLRVSFRSDQENNTRLWNAYAVRDLKGRDGFNLALRLTLYRPRDILVLLNNAFLSAAGDGRREIVLDDVEQTAKSISENRLIDLYKEYESIFRSLSAFASAFAGGSSELSLKSARSKVDLVLSRDDLDKESRREIAFYENATQVIQSLYGIGFLGFHDEKSGAYVFCHDGRDPAREVSDGVKILVHPCYWLALNLSEKTLDIDGAENIHDEYDIEVSSVTEEQRQKRVGQIIEEIKSIASGRSDCHAFEEWALQALKLIFAGSLSNFELHPNKGGLQQRDVVATNMTASPVWNRIFQDYGVRHVLFEVKNYTDLSANDYRQLNSYLSKTYGSLGFFVTRATDNNLKKDKELSWAKTLFFEHDKVAILLSEKYLVKHLSKIRKPQKHDAAEKELNSLIDTYVKRYLIQKSI